jgi:hypothetical protein
MILLQKVSAYALARLQESTTYVGFWLILDSDFHLVFNGDFKTRATQWFMATAGLIAVLIKEGWQPK